MHFGDVVVASDCSRWRIVDDSAAAGADDIVVGSDVPDD